MGYRHPGGDVGTKPTITATFSTTTDGSILIQEVSGLAAGNTLAAMIDGTAGTLGNDSSAGPVGPPSYASSAADEYLVYVFGDDGDGVTVTSPPAGYTADPANITGSGLANSTIYYANSTGDTESGSFTFSGSTEYGLILVAFKLPGGAPSTGPVFRQATSPIRARVLPSRTARRGVYTGISPKDTSSGTGQIQWNAGGPVHNPPSPLRTGPLPNFPVIIAANSGWRGAGHSR